MDINARHFVLLAVLLWNPASDSIVDARSPANSWCEEGVPPPSYAPLGAAPNVRYLKDTQVSAPPITSACVGMSMPESSSFVEVAGTFRIADGKNELLSRIGNVSALVQVLYWSTTDHDWRHLISAATALTTDGHPRTNFTAVELESGQDLYLSQTDSRSSNAATYRMRLKYSDERGLVLEVANVSPLRWWGLTLYNPGELHTVYVVERRSADVWTYYSLTAVGKGRWPASGHANSYINRVVAMYRHYTGVPTDSEPPPAP